MSALHDLKNVTGHIDKVMNAQTSEEVKKNRLRLKATIEAVRWLSLQACALRGHDESTSSHNRGNLIEMIKLMGRMNVDIANVVLDNAPQNAIYTSPLVQKDVLHILGSRIRNKIRDEVGNSKFCILVDTSKAEHYSMIYRLICLVLTLPVSTATTERAFSAMKIIKTILRNKMEEEYLRDTLVLNIEREYAEEIDPEEVIDEFYSKKNRRVQLK